MPAIPPVSVGTAVFGGPLPVLIMGPCVIESEAHALKMAFVVQQAAAAVGLPAVFKASFDKANRTSHASFRGVGLEQGLRILARCREATGLPVTTDVHECWQVEPAARVVDLLQLPALLCRQTDLVEACAASGVPTSIKKGQFLAPWDCGNLVAKFRHAGAKVKRAVSGARAARHRLILIERGTSFGYNTLVSDLRALPMLRDLGVPVVYDGTHSVQAPGGMGSKSGGAGHLAPAMMRAAMAVGVEGVFLETHDRPAKALSDGPNSIPVKELPALLADLRAIHDLLGRRPPPRPRT
jgi:2-dehydro-3-deoxyphosphooctonate aldolase (KDO 8-P synthase)